MVWFSLGFPKDAEDEKTPGYSLHCVLRLDAEESSVSGFPEKIILQISKRILLEQNVLSLKSSEARNICSISNGILMKQNFEDIAKEIFFRYWIEKFHYWPNSQLPQISLIRCMTLLLVGSAMDLNTKW